ncbi:hypothetical protein L0244_05100, partial [bacterium]|nr:hypothetical protein [bacterium]
TSSVAGFTTGKIWPDVLFTYLPLIQCPIMFHLSTMRDAGCAMRGWSKSDSLPRITHLVSRII